jgi:hypothetical protein
MQANQLEHALGMLKHIIGYFLVSKDFYGRLSAHWTNGQLKVWSIGIGQHSRPLKEVAFSVGKNYQCC